MGGRTDTDAEPVRDSDTHETILPYPR